MGKIATLREEIYKKIAAGEVVQNPLSVVKELVENSLDAGAKKIIIKLGNGGKTMINVTDDGSGFESDDVKVAFMRHSTSKFREFSDFESLNTLGFRGEALPSILEVSDIVLETSSGDDGFGIKCVFSGGIPEKTTEIAYPKGTSITVKNLFSNFPVRKKFLKSDRSEMNRIMAFLEQSVLVNFDVSFELTHNGKVVFVYNAVKSLKERCYQVFGKDFTENLIEIDFDYFGYGIRGLISKLNTGVANKKHQYFFVNGRNVKEKTLYAAFNNTFIRFLEKSRSAAGIVLLDIPPGEIDVNIHPMKLEIKFEDSQKVYQLIKKGIEKSMGMSVDVSAAKPFQSHTTESDFVYDKRIVSETHGDSQPTLFSIENVDDDGFNVIGQYKDSYIIIEKDGDLVVVDQHNADERANFDKLKEEFEKEGAVSVTPLFPMVIELTPKEIESLDEKKKEMLEKAGFKLEHMGGNSYDVKKYPQVLEERTVPETVKGILGFDGGKTDFADKILAEIACKSSIKVNYKLHHDQMRKVVKRLFESSNPYFCPHKRPIIVNFPLETIEKSLKRR